MANAMDRCASCGFMHAEHDLVDGNFQCINQPGHFRTQPPAGEGPDEAKLLSYQWAHEEAVRLGYPSLTEALEALDRAIARAALSTAVIRGGE